MCGGSQRLGCEIAGNCDFGAFRERVWVMENAGDAVPVGGGSALAEPTIRCPRCQAEIKLTESLAAPLLEATRKDYEAQLARKDAEVSRREQAFAEREAAIAKERESLDQQVAERLTTERVKIAAEETKKARLALDAELKEQKSQTTELQEVLRQREAKLAEAQKAQADLLRQKRELEDARRALELSVETRVQESLAKVRELARKEADEAFSRKAAESEQTIARLQQQVGDLAKKEQAVKEQQAALAREREAMEEALAERLTKERAKIAGEEAGKVRAAVGAELEQQKKERAELEEVLKQREVKLAEAQKAQAELIRKQRELDDAKREMELTIEKRIGESLAVTREQAKKEAEEQLSLKVLEKDQIIQSMQTKIEDLKRKAEQGSQQLQGEVLELQLEAMLAGKFPQDRIEPVPKGEHGGDIVHRVLMPAGTVCGTILWETKRAKNWVDGWLSKLREDQRAAKAEIAVLVSAVLPKGVEAFDQVEGIWVIHPKVLLPVAMSLRQMLIEVHCARQASEGQQTKMEMVYQYLTGPKFRLRVQAIVEAFSDMTEDLQKEKKAIMKQWAKREEQLARVAEATTGMYGELQGIAGRSLKEIEGLDIRVLGAGDEGAVG